MLCRWKQIDAQVGGANRVGLIGDQDLTPNGGLNPNCGHS
jgi:hypothetical protein